MLPDDDILNSVTPVILCGGAGRRLRPISTRQMPKPFLRFGFSRSLLQQALLRVEKCAEPIIILNQKNRSLLLRDLDAIESRPSLIILEPAARNTAPALAAVSLVSDADLMLVLPSDHVIRNPDILMEAVARSVPAAQAGAIISFGIKPTRPETGFGYLRIGARAGGNLYAVEQFMEKPDRATAQSLLRQGDCVWNSGIFLTRRDVLRDALARFQPEMMQIVSGAVARGWSNEQWFMLNQSFGHAPPISIDVAVMEHVPDLLCCPVPLVWNDIGSWMGLLRQVS